MKYVTYGIHNRLHYLIKGTGGLDKESRRKYLKNKYGFDAETINLILMYDVEHLLKEHTISEIKYYIEQKNDNSKILRERAVNNLKYLLTDLCCASDMLRLGNQRSYY